MQALNLPRSLRVRLFAINSQHNVMLSFGWFQHSDNRQVGGPRGLQDLVRLALQASESDGVPKQYTLNGHVDMLRIMT